jgi:predicted TIM-barrel fold metal-dependent hydrolase
VRPEKAKAYRTALNELRANGWRTLDAQTRVTRDEGSADLEGIRIIDCDSHFTEPADLWLSRAPQTWKGRVPVQQTVDGHTSWYLDDEVFASLGGNTIQTGHNKILGLLTVQPFELIDASAWAVKERLELLDEMGIYAQILYPNAVGFSSNHIFAIEDEGQRTAVLEMYNDFLVDVQSESLGRLFPQGLLPVWDMDLTIKEMTRLLDKGMRGFTLTDKPEMLGLPELPEPYFDPMWDLFNESGAVVNFHIGSGRRREDSEKNRNRFRADAPQGVQAVEAPMGLPTVAEPGWRSFGRQRYMVVHATQGFMSNVRIVINLCMSNLFDRYPNLKVVSAESGIGWVPFVLEALEYQYDEMVTKPDEISFAQRRPREYFRDHIYAMFWFEQTAPAKLLNDIGVNNVLIESDVPHPTCLYPNMLEHFERVLSGVDPHTVRRVLQDNAAELYRIPIPAQSA